jgi:hypothetical protein
MVNSLDVLRKELDQAKRRVTALTSAIAVLGGSTTGAKRFVSAATRKKIAAAQKRRWAKEKTGKS